MGVGEKGYRLSRKHSSSESVSPSQIGEIFISTYEWMYSLYFGLGMGHVNTVGDSSPNHVGLEQNLGCTLSSGPSVAAHSSTAQFAMEESLDRLGLSGLLVIVSM